MNRTIFLIDGLGALLSTILLCAFSIFEGVFGNALSKQFWLMPIPIIFATYSITLYFINHQNWHIFLQIIAIANIFYCCIITISTYLYFDGFTILGRIYIFSEIVTVLSLSIYELKLAKK